MFFLLRDVSSEKIHPIFRQFVDRINIIQCNGTPDEVLVITWYVKKIEQKLINTNIITRHNDIVICCDQQL